MGKIPLIVVVGPTASGKTRLGVELAHALCGEVVSADSMQIYRGISIASAAPSAEEQQGVPHHMLEFLESDSSYSVADYVSAANSVIEDIYSRNKQPILVGGTGLYISSLTEGIAFSEQKTDLALRKQLEAEFDALGGEEMLSRLMRIDSMASESLHISDRRRIIRAFEIYYSTGLTKTEQNELSRKTPSKYECIFIGLNFKNRDILYDRINRRVDLMLDAGLIEEAKSSLSWAQGSGAAQAIGHKELQSYFLGEKSLEETVEALKQSTRRYAKRQLTWFRKNKGINWIYPDVTPDVLSEALRIIKENKE